MTRTEAGAVSFHARMTHEVTGEVHECASQLELKWAAVVLLKCEYEGGRFEYCDRRALSAPHRRVLPVIEIGSEQHPAPSMVSLNGRSGWPANAEGGMQPVPLADVAKLEKGRYSIDVAYGPAQAHYELTVGAP